RRRRRRLGPARGSVRRGRGGPVDEEKVYRAAPPAVMLKVGNNLLLLFAGLVFVGVVGSAVFGPSRAGAAPGAWPALAVLAVGGGLAILRYGPRLRSGLGVYEVRL